MVYTYLLKNNKGTFYIGISENPNRRLNEHNAGKVLTTRLKKPWNLVYLKSHKNYIEARKQEKWLKKKNHNYKNKLAGQAAERYLNELEREGKLTQHGQIGPSVFYTLK
jgi:putative endonuclease